MASATSAWWTGSAGSGCASARQRRTTPPGWAPLCSGPWLSATPCSSTCIRTPDRCRTRPSSCPSALRPVRGNVRSAASCSSVTPPPSSFPNSSTGRSPAAPPRPCSCAARVRPCSSWPAPATGRTRPLPCASRWAMRGWSRSWPCRGARATCTAGTTAARRSRRWSCPFRTRLGSWWPRSTRTRPLPTVAAASSCCSACSPRSPP